MSHLGEERLLRYVLDDLEPDVALQVERHVAGCPRCRERLDAERRLDELILASASAAPAGSAERALERLWETLDAPPPRPAVRPLLRRVAPWLPALAAAAAVLLMLRPEVDGPSPVRPPAGPTAAHPPAVPAPEAAPWALPVVIQLADPVDAGRLAAVREEVSAALRLEDAADRAAALEALRRQGWPLGKHLRALALGEDESLAGLALLAAADDATTLAALVGHPTRGDLVLTLLEQDASAVAGSVTLRRALEARASDDDRCLELLGRAPGTQAARALDRVVDARMAAILAREPSGLSRGLASLAERLPPDIALPLVVDTVRDRPGLRPGLEGVFARLLERDRAAVTEQLGRDLLAGAGLPPVAWLARQSLVELVPSLLLVLDDPSPDPRALDALIALGDEASLSGLHDLWVGSGLGSDRPELAALVSLLERLGPAPADFLARLRAGGLEPVRRLASALPPGEGPALVLDLLSLEAHDEGPALRDVDLLMELARTGGPEEAEALARWLAARPVHPAAPLGWTICAHLDAGRAQAAWTALGLDPDRLARAARFADRRLAQALPPSDSVLAPLGRALRPR